MDNEAIIEYTDSFKNELYDAIDYIKFKLKNVNAANVLLEEVKEAIEKRKIFADAYKEIQIKNKYNDKYRMIKIRNFAVLYTIGKRNNKMVMTVQNFVYGKRDFLNHI